MKVYLIALLKRLAIKLALYLLRKAGEKLKEGL
jgi:hypothetical protein